jgi:cyclopropane-fatty-acyl-phospholipid synthase
MDLHVPLLPSDQRTAGHGGWLYEQLDELISPAGVSLNGGHAWDPRIRRPRAVRRILFGGRLGAGEAYVDGDWDCEALDALAARLLAAGIEPSLTPRSPVAFLNELRGILINRQSRARARADVMSHYEMGADLYAAMLGPTMTYSCGYWRDASTLDEAQYAKHELVCHKLQLKAGMRMLDVGCGWGTFASHAAERYGVHVVGITLSPSQAQEARRRSAGLPVEIREQDYRDVPDRFDRIVSIGMLEHVGPGNYRTFFDAMARALKPGGLLLVHTIGCLTTERTSDPWIARYVFPGSVVPSAAQLMRASEGLFILEDWHSFGADYDRTVMAWHQRFDEAWPRLAASYSDRFRRLWRYYLLTTAGAFRARHNQLWQLVLSPEGVAGGYRRVCS